MKIGELAAATGLATSAIRFYEQSGLLAPAQRAANGYRSYPPETVERLRFIQVAQGLGFSLDSLRAALLDRGELSQEQMHAGMLQRLDERLDEIDHLLATLRSQRTDLHAVRERLLASWATGECLDPACVALTSHREPPTRRRLAPKASDPDRKSVNPAKARREAGAPTR